VEFSAGSVKKTQRLWNTYVNMDGNFGINSTATFFVYPYAAPLVVTIKIELDTNRASNEQVPIRGQKEFKIKLK
jgi:hypothetical protein